MRGVFTVRETAGGEAVLESMLFEESGGGRDFVDAWCWGDAGVKIIANSTVESDTLAYCSPVIRTTSPGNSATLTLVYRTPSGNLITLQSVASRN